MSEYMTDFEIRQFYKQSKHRNKAIGILADMNLCSKKEIQKIIEEENMATEKAEQRTAAIHDYNSGMTIKEVAERYQVAPKVMYNNFQRWAKKGLVVLRKDTPTAENKPVHKPAIINKEFDEVVNSMIEEIKETKPETKEEPAPAATDTDSCETINSNIVPPAVENVKDMECPVEAIKPTYKSLYYFYAADRIKAGISVYMLDKHDHDVVTLNDLTVGEYFAVMQEVESDKQERFHLWTEESND